MIETQKPSRDVIRENEGFHQYLIRKHERLTILLDHNLENRKDPSEADILLLKEEYEAYVKTALPWNLKYDQIVRKGPEQMSIPDTPS